MIASDARGRLWRYGVLGVASNGFCYLVFLALLWAQVPPVAANGLCYLLGVTISYVGNRRWTFRSENAHLPDMLRFAAAYGLGLGFSMLCVAALIRFMPAAMAQLVTVVATAAVIFSLLTLLRFGRPTRRDAPCR